MAARSPGGGGSGFHERSCGPTSKPQRGAGLDRRELRRPAAQHPLDTMPAAKHILGIDGGLAHLGWCVALVNHGPEAKPFIIDAGVVETVKRSEGTAADSHAARAEELARELQRIVEVHGPEEIVAEAFSPPRDARNAAMLAWSWGVLCAVAQQHGLPIRAKTPMALKAALTGNRTAKKDEMIAAVREQYPEASFPARRDLHEHLADAVAAVHLFYGARAT